MPRKKAQTAPEFNPAEFDPAMQPQAAEVIQQVAASTVMPGEQPAANGEAAPKKQWVRGQNPRGWANKKGAGDQRVRALLSTFENPNKRGEESHAWVIRFEVPPNEMEGYSKEKPHPVLKMLKEDGYKWDFDGNDNKGGHGKHAGITMFGKVVEGDPFGDAREDAYRVMVKAAEMVGAKVDQGRIPE